MPERRHLRTNAPVDRLHERGRWSGPRIMYIIRHSRGEIGGSEETG